MTIADIGEACIIAFAWLAGTGVALHIAGQLIERRRWRREMRRECERKAALRSGVILTGRKGGAA
jgi:hypothetical protein